MNPSPRRWFADSVAVMVALIWGGNNVVAKAALADWGSPLAFNAIRFPLGTLAIGTLMLIVEKDWRLPRHLWWRVALLGLAGNALNQVLFISGLSRTLASNTAVIMATMPVLTAIIGALTGLDPATPRLWVGTAVSFSGILLVTLARAGGFGPLQFGDLLLLGAATTWAGYTVFSSPLARQATALKVTTYAMMMASIPVFSAGLPELLRQDWGAISATSWAGLLYASVLSNAIAYFFYVWAVQQIGSTRTSLFANLAPVVTAILAATFLGERWVPLQWLGGAAVLVGVLVARWDVISQGLRRRPAA